MQGLRGPVPEGEMQGSRIRPSPYGWGYAVLALMTTD